MRAGLDRVGADERLARVLLAGRLAPTLTGDAALRFPVGDAQALADAGIERIWGVTGDSLNGLNDSLRRMGRIDWMSVPSKAWNSR